MDARDGLAEILPPIGHNSPPSDLDVLRERLEDEAGSLLLRRDELLASVGRAPAEVGDEEMAGKFADLIKLVTACHKNAEAARVARKEPFLANGRAVDGFYKGITEPLEKAKKAVEQKLTVYQRKVAEEERRRREAEARAAAEEAERQRKEAAAKLATLDEIAETADAATADVALDDAISAAELSKQAMADAERARREAEAKAADLSRTRGTFGSVASLRTYWDVADIDREKLDLEALRPHLSMDALEKASRSFVRAGGRTLRGARIFENTSSVVR